MRVWDVASGRLIHQLAGGKFALVEGPSDKHKTYLHVLTALGDTLLIYAVAKDHQHAEDGGAATSVACFKAPSKITSVRCHGAAICVGCHGGPLCLLSAPFLAA